MRGIGIIIMAGAGLALGGCQTLGGGQGDVDRLNMEIAQIGQRLVAVEGDINTNTAEIARRTEGVYAQASYRPIKSWASAFSAGPEANRTATFQQTDRGGNLAEQSHRCVILGRKRPGYWVRIDESRSTKASLLIEQFTATSDASGLVLGAPIKFEARTQLGANFRPPCQGGSIGMNVGVTGEARPDTVFRLGLGPVEDGAIGYNLAMVAPNTIDVEMAVHVGHIGRVRFTIPMKNMARELGAGKIDLLYDTDGSILLPDGGKLGYRVATSNPTLQSGADGFGVGTAVTVQVEKPLAAEMAKQR